MKTLTKVFALLLLLDFYFLPGIPVYADSGNDGLEKYYEAVQNAQNEKDKILLSHPELSAFAKELEKGGDLNLTQSAVTKRISSLGHCSISQVINGLALVAYAISLPETTRRALLSKEDYWDALSFHRKWERIYEETQEAVLGDRSPCARQLAAYEFAMAEIDYRDARDAMLSAVRNFEKKQNQKKYKDLVPEPAPLNPRDRHRFLLAEKPA